jgi:SAM-dependent methyltransferase
MNPCDKVILDKNVSVMCPLCQNQKWRAVVVAPEWQIRSCENCSNAWTHPPPDQYDYENNDFHSDTVGKNPETGIEKLPPQWQRSVRQQVRHLQRCVPRAASVLEIGCGEGILLQELSRAGFKVSGIEPSTTASERARRRGLNVITGHFPLEKLAGPFDVVILSHVLEHLPDPGQIIEQIKRVAPGGYLFLVQSNYTGIIPVLQKAKWYAWVPTQHFWHFTPQGLEMFCSNRGIRSVNCEFSSLVHPYRLWWVHLLGFFRPRFFDQFHILFRIPST